MTNENLLLQYVFICLFFSMENYDKNYRRELKALQSCFERFKKRMAKELKNERFEPADLGNELGNNLESMGIKKTDIVPWESAINNLLRECTFGANKSSLYHDQLFHCLIGSTRRPYHDISTGKFSRTQLLPVEDVLDASLLAEFILKQKLKK